jgi:penicillin amidase
MERRTFVQTVGATAAAGTLGTGVSSAEIPKKGVEILTNDYNVSHVYADDLYSLAYGQGWVQARDRLFQMDVFRMIGRGRSAEVAGPGQISMDISAKRDLYTDEELQQMWEEAKADDEYVKDALEGFTDGVNAKMQEMRDSLAPSEWPGEFTLLGRDPDPWKPTDTVAVLSYAIGVFGVAGGSERGNAKELAEMFDEMDSEEEAWNAFNDKNNVTVPDTHYGSISEDAVDGGYNEGLSYDEVPEEQLEKVRAAKNTQPWGLEKYDNLQALDSVFREALGIFRGQGLGSNAAIYSGDVTETGKPMLAGGPQMGLIKPPVIHEIGLHGAEFDVSGIGVVGTPAVIIGRTPDFAWTITTSGDDMVDTIAVDLDPEDRYRYKWDGEWHEMKTRTYHHEANIQAGWVQGAFKPDEAIQEVAWVEQEGTRMPVVSYNPDENVAFVKRVTARMDELKGAAMWAKIGRQNNRAEFEEQLKDEPFGFNFHYVDHEDIAYYRVGKLAETDSDADPRLPSTPSLHNWTGFKTGTDIGATEVNPDRGYVVNWNNAPAPGWDAHEGNQWSGVHRVDQLERLSQEIIERENSNISLDDVDEIIRRASFEHPYAPSAVPHFIDAARSTDDTELNAMADELQNWADTNYTFRPAADGKYPSGGMAIWEAVRREIQDRLYRGGDMTFDPTAGSGIFGKADPYVADHGGGAPNGVHLYNVLDGTAEYPWLGDTPDQAIRESMKAAFTTLKDEYGSGEPSDWRMKGRKASFFPLGGANKDKIYMKNKASYQQSIAMTEGVDVAGCVLPPSNDGHIGNLELVKGKITTEPGDLTDQLETYTNHEFKPHPITREKVDEFMSESMMLDPLDEREDPNIIEQGANEVEETVDEVKDTAVGDDGEGGLFGGGGPGFTMPAVGAALGSAALLKKLQSDDSAE